MYASFVKESTIKDFADANTEMVKDSTVVLESHMT